MMIETGKNKNGVILFSASQEGCMGRMCVCEATDYHKAVAGLREMLEAQKGEQYAIEQQQTALSLQNDPEGKFK